MAPDPVGPRPPVATLRRPIRAALVQVGLAGVALTAIEAVLYPLGPSRPLWSLYLYAGVGVVYLAAGLLAWERRPSNGTGGLLCLCGFSVLAASLQNTGPTAFVVAGSLLGELPIGVLLHVVLAYPGGRVPDRWSRALVIAGYFITGPMHMARDLLATLPAAGVLPWTPLTDAAHVVRVAQVSAFIAVVASTATVLAFRSHRTEPRLRIHLTAVWSYGTLTLAFLLFSSNVLRPWFDLSGETVFQMQVAVFIGLPIVFTIGVLFGGFERTRALDELAAGLGADGADLRDALREALGDASLELAFVLPGRDALVDRTGRPVSAAAGRKLVEIETAAGPVGAIVYDSTMLPDPEPVRRAGSVVAVAVERERLTAELRASRDALRDSRMRIVEAGDRERQRLARDLHDGLQARLVVAALRAGQLAEYLSTDARLGADAVLLRTDLEATIEQLRDLVHGVLPDLLVERGLVATLDDLLDRAPLRSRLDLSGWQTRQLPAHVELAAYFVVAEALANTIKHADATELVVGVASGDGVVIVEVSDDGRGGAAFTEGTGLLGVADRVEALGGEITLDSAAGNGTRLRVELPCES